MSRLLRLTNLGGKIITRTKLGGLVTPSVFERTFLFSPLGKSGFFERASNCGYASKKVKKGKKKEVEEDDEEEMAKPTIVFDTEKYNPKFTSCMDRLKRDLAAVRVGRANPAILDNIHVECGEDFGGKLPLNQVGQVSVKDPQNLQIIVFEQQLLKAVEKAIQNADLNLNPIIEASKIKVPIPKLTAQTREAMIKQIAQSGEKTKTAMRSVRQEAMKVISGFKKKGSGFSADDVKELEKEIQTMMDRFTKEVDTVIAAKGLELKG